MNPPRFANPADADRFVVGVHWFSLDDGKTWIEGELPPSEPGAPARTVIRIDNARGIIEVE